MRLNKVQQETYEALLKLIALRGKPWVFGWALGTIIRLSQHDPQLRRTIRNQIKD